MAGGHLVPASTVHRQEEANTEGGGGAKARQAEGLALRHVGQEGTAPCLQGQTPLTQAPCPRCPYSHPSPRAPVQQPTDRPHLHVVVGLLLGGTWVPTVQCWPGDPWQGGVTAKEQLQVIWGAFTTLLAWEPARATSWLCHL